MTGAGWAWLILGVLVGAGLILDGIGLIRSARARARTEQAERAAALESAYASMKSADLEKTQRYVAQLCRMWAAEVQGSNAARASHLLATAAVYEIDADMEKTIRERAER